ncbi:hypothetical protein [Erythrobacter sp.]|jgi:hypothetical protein|uniref:hypothetical protein n=1 Tax=Erythrobacter sp. TaxID=1042 RepID=UPI002EA706B3|nr:hypothetical protein [Erythrobacter sp.]
MRIPFRSRTMALTTPLALAFALAACTAEDESANAGVDDMPEPTIAEEPDTISDPAIVQAVPGVDAVDPEGEASSNAELSEGENILPSGEDGTQRGEERGLQPDEY